MEHEVSYNSNRKGISNPMTSSTREGKEMRDNVLGGSIWRKRIMEGSQDGGRKLPLKSIPSPIALNALQQPYQLH